MTVSKGNIAVLLSGRGSNFESIFRHSQKPESLYRVAVVISDRSGAPGLAKASGFGLDAYHVGRKKYRSKNEFETAILDILKGYPIDLICLAGYMKIVGSVLLQAFPRRILNIHPALLPSFPGLDAQKKALEYGVKISGCTVHFVNRGVDQGPIILQKAVEVTEKDNLESLSRRILKQEHQIYPRAIDLYFQNRLEIRGRRVHIIHGQ